MEYIEKPEDLPYGWFDFKDEDFGEYESMEYQVKEHIGVFPCSGKMYSVKYSPEQYEKQLKEINSHTFLEEPVGKLIPAPKVEDNGWLVRVMNEEYYEYPKHIRMIGTNNEKNMIVYMVFDDTDLDYISEEQGEKAMKDFIKKYIGFKFKKN